MSDSYKRPGWHQQSMPCLLQANKPCGSSHRSQIYRSIGIQELMLETKLRWIQLQGELALSGVFEHSNHHGTRLAAGFASWRLLAGHNLTDKPLDISWRPLLLCLRRADYSLGPIYISYRISSSYIIFLTFLIPSSLYIFSCNPARLVVATYCDQTSLAE